MLSFNQVVPGSSPGWLISEKAGNLNKIEGTEKV